MKKTIFAVVVLTISLTGTAWGQEQRRAPRRQVGSTALGGGSGVGVKDRKAANLGDTATHEVGHVRKRRAEAQDGSGTDNANRQGRRRPNAIGNPMGLGGTVTAGVRNKQGNNLGDTATHEVGHKGNRRSQLNDQSQQVSGRKKNQDIEVENDETHRTRSRAARTETVDKDETLTVSRGKRRKALPKATP